MQFIIESFLEYDVRILIPGRRAHHTVELTSPRVEIFREYRGKSYATGKGSNLPRTPQVLTSRTRI